MEQPLILTEVRDRVGILTLNRPQQFNCLSLEMHRQLRAALDELEHHPEVRCLLIQAEGRHFCTGADLGEVQALRGSVEKLEQFLATGLESFRRLEQSPLPVVAAVQGLALAGGLELVLACDIAIAAESARLGDQHAQFGLVPGWGGSQRLPRLIGRRRALELMLSARWLDAGEALSFGLVNQLAPDAELRERALAYCRNLAARSRPGLALMKQLVDRGLDLPLAEALDLELALAAPALQSDDVSEGLAAFTAKRAPRFAR
ncbi:MAG: enoyl-CoA hydratase/isomerase family protein [Pseudomonadota bacterium]